MAMWLALWVISYKGNETCPVQCHPLFNTSLLTDQCETVFTATVIFTTACMAVVGPRASIPDWIPAIHSKCDSKQATFYVPTSVLLIARQTIS